MRWKGGRRSTNIEDRRGSRAPKLLGGGVGTIVLVLVALYFGVDPTPLLQTMQGGGGASSSGTRPTAEDLKNDPLADMVSVVVADTEDVWTEIFAAQGRRYQAPTLVLFRARHARHAAWARRRWARSIVRPTRRPIST